MTRKANSKSHGAALRKAQRRKQGVTVAISFLLAVTLWFLVSMNVRTFEANVSLPLQVSNIPKDLSLRQQVPSHMEVTVKGKGISLLYQNMRKLPDTVAIDFRSYQATGSFEAGAHLEIINRSLEKGLQAVACSPNEISLQHFVKDKKLVPILVDVQYQLLPSLRLSRPLRLQPDSVMVVGPPEVLDTLHRWRVPALKVNGLVSQDTTLALPPGHQPPLEVVQKEILVTLDVDAFTEDAQEVRITWKNLPQGVRAQLSHEHVTVHYLVPLSKYDDAHAQPITVTVDYLDLKPESKLLFPRVEHLPEGAEGLRLDPPYLECVVTLP